MHGHDLQVSICAQTKNSIRNEDNTISSTLRAPEPLRLAASSYLNTAPLIWSFLRGSRCGQVDLVEAVPARCAELLANADVEAALVPVIEYQRISGISLVPDVCVGSKKQVRSVVLVSRNDDLKNVHRVALDESSRTSAALVKIIFREFLGFEPSWTTRSPNLQLMLEENDTALIIGDPAMTFPRDGLTVWDMASLWREHTGLGFVFAMWMVRDEAADKSARVDFAGARDEGLARSQEIVDHYGPVLGLPRNTLEQYLKENICFYLDEDMRAGLDLYFRLAHKHRMLETLKPLKTIGP
ncbi:MAG: chorismate dehydratase [Blastocatellia bacterium]|nr:chorismate dehydratase [Blastocatellia bacterium]